MPVNLTSAFRRMIATALTIEIKRHYKHSARNQWVFQEGTSTECAIAYAVNKMRQNLPFAALLDLKKAYDCVPRARLQQMLDKRLPSLLSTMLRPLLWPMTIKTKHQTSSTCIRTLAGVPQGDAPSLQLFNIFMDHFLEQISTSPRQGVASLFVDDVLIIARAAKEIQKLTDKEMNWASANGMEWTVEKSSGIALPFQVWLNNRNLTNAEQVPYLGVSLGPHGLTEHKLLDRLGRLERSWPKLSA